MHPKRLFIFASLIVSAISARAATGDFPGDYQTQVIRSLVKLHDTSGRFAGSAFAIGRDADRGILLLTAHHCVDPHRNFDVDLYPHGSIDVYAATEIVACAVAYDLALLRVTTDQPVPALPTIDERFHASAKLPALVVGFPSGRLHTTQTTIVSDYYCKSPYGTVFKSWRLRDPIEPGTSGSPLLAPTQNGPRVIGVCWAGNEHYAYAVADIHEFLNKYAPLRKEPDVRSVISSRSPPVMRSFHTINMQLHHLLD